MPRVVIQGTPGTYRVITPADIPSTDLRQSYFYWCDFSGRNLSNYDLRDIDVVNCRATNVILPNNILWMQSRNTDWTGATIPSGLHLQHDLVYEYLRQRRATLPVAQRPRVTTVMQNILDFPYEASFRDSIWRVMQEHNLTKEQVRDFFINVFQNRPKILALLRWHVQSNLVTSQRHQRPDYSQYPIMLQDGRKRFIDVRDAITLTPDRYQAARDLEAWLLPRYGPYAAWFEQVTPWPLAHTMPLSRFIGTPEFGWWRKAD